jgi:hypothetical protein
MSADPPPREESERQPEGGLTVTLWVLAALIAVLEIAWWWSARIYSP